ICRRIVGTNHRGVVDLRHRSRRGVIVVLEVVGLEPCVSLCTLLLDGQELDPALPAFVPVHRVVGGAGHYGVLDVGGATKELDAIVVTHVHLDEVDVGVAAASTQRQPVELVVRADGVASELDASIVQASAVVCGISATVGAAAVGGLDTLDLTRRHVDGSAPEQNHTTPITPASAAGVFGAGEHDGGLVPTASICPPVVITNADPPSPSTVVPASMVSVPLVT